MTLSRVQRRVPPPPLLWVHLPSEDQADNHRPLQSTRAWQVIALPAPNLSVCCPAEFRFILLICNM